MATSVNERPSAHARETFRGMRTIPEETWLEARCRHVERVSPWVDMQLSRSSRGIKHPVYDFLFEYNGLRPTHLSQWHPGLGVLLEGRHAQEFLAFRQYSRMENGIGVDPAKFPANRLASVNWMLQLLKGCRERPPQFGCFGLHEWAMVYRSPDVRHSNYPLRLPTARLAEIVESAQICCSHYDAFRFFTPAAQPLNKLQPTRKLQPELEQRGCLHVNMDLFKWAHKLSPWIASELVAETFILAARIREVDMRASPYDLRSLGFEPIPIETPEGRAEYEQYQREFTKTGEPLRDALIDACEQILHAVPGCPGP